MKPLYFDYNATTPILPQVKQAMLPYFSEHFGNPGSDHVWGLAPREALSLARKQVATLIRAASEEIFFTSGATEANNLALFGILSSLPGHLIVSALEHPAVMNPAKMLEQRGFSLSITRSNQSGVINPETIFSLVQPETKLISLMLANNEVGTLQPVKAVTEWARPRGIFVHTDAAQALGKIPVDVQDLGVDLLTIAGHKMYAPKGIGVLYVRKGTPLVPLLFGGGQERGLRSGTENVSLIVALGQACCVAAEDLPVEEARQRDLIQLLEQGLSDLGVTSIIHGYGANRLPNTLSVGFPDFSAGAILSGLAGLNVAASAGAACHGSTHTISPVLQAMDVPESLALGTIRLSLGRLTSRNDVQDLLMRMSQVITQLE